MDTTAHRIIKQARDLLVDGLSLGLNDLGHQAGAGWKHDLDDAQANALDSIVWRLWDLMEQDPAPPECQNCATPLTQPKTGRPRRYCSPACRQADYRARNGYELTDAELLAQADAPAEG